MTVDMEKCKRIVQYFWDPEPRNDEPAAMIWCLGREYAQTSEIQTDCKLGLNYRIYLVLTHTQPINHTAPQGRLGRPMLAYQVMHGQKNLFQISGLESGLPIDPISHRFHEPKPQKQPPH